MEPVGVNADARLDDDNVMVTLTGTWWQLNVHASPAEWERLPDVRSADGYEGSSIRVGTTNDSPAWWSLMDGQLAVSAGPDPQSSDVIFILPPSTLDAIEHALANLDV